MGPLMRLARRVGGALLARGEVIPAVTRIVQGRTEVVSPEVVIPKGILRSKSVVSALISGAFGVANLFGWDFGFTEAEANTAYTVISTTFAGLAGVFRVTATMPTRGPSL
jgi:hypothetical protein